MFGEKHCCICGKVFTGWGNDPWPLEYEGECCAECNWTKVLPARLALVEANRKDNEEVSK